jgi:hypothetical protein
MQGRMCGWVSPRLDPDLAQEALDPERRRDLGMEHLDGHPTMVPEVFRQVYRAHATAAELALERVALGQGGLESFHGLDQIGVLDRDVSGL